MQGPWAIGDYQKKFVKICVNKRMVIASKQAGAELCQAQTSLS